MTIQLTSLVSENGKDLCVSCKKETQYPAETHVDAREHYIEGAGQLCRTCYEGAYTK